jgi:hypothetical protein
MISLYKFTWFMIDVRDIQRRPMNALWRRSPALRQPAQGPAWEDSESKASQSAVDSPVPPGSAGLSSLRHAPR